MVPPIALPGGGQPSRGGRPLAGADRGGHGLAGLHTVQDLGAAVALRAGFEPALIGLAVRSSPDWSI